MTKNTKKKELTCADCADCCRYTALEIDRPTTKQEFSNLFWHLLHEGVSVYIDHKRIWHIEFQGKCSALGPDLRCTNYDDRPLICRQYDLDNCTRHSKGEYYKYMFHTPDELKAYLKKRRIDFAYKRLPR